MDTTKMPPKPKPRADVKSQRNVVKVQKQPLEDSSEASEDSEEETVPKSVKPKIQPSPVSQATTVVKKIQSLEINPVKQVFVNIMPKLTKKLQDSPQSAIAPFFRNNIKYVDKKDWQWGNVQLVRLPHSPLNKLDRNSQDSNWKTICDELENLKLNCNSGGVEEPLGTLIKNAVCKYVPYASYFDFSVLSDETIQPLLLETLPIISTLAMALPTLLSMPLPVIYAGDNKEVYMTRQLCASLVANAFFCTFPPPSPETDLDTCNMFRLFKTSNNSNLKTEKIKCLLYYFKAIDEMSLSRKNEIVSFERKHEDMMCQFQNSTKPLCNVTVNSSSKIEDSTKMLQVHFANKAVGFAAYEDICSVDEIRLFLSPELVVVRLIMEPLDNHEAITVTGSGVYSQYSGFRETFQVTGRKEVTWNTDDLGRSPIQFTAIDAYPFPRSDYFIQFEEAHIQRELHKCFVGFSKDTRSYDSIATGNWGCGGFHGDPDLKFFIQWISASEQDCSELLYHTLGNDYLTSEIMEFSKHLRSSGATVGDLYESVLDKAVNYNSDDPFFESVKESNLVYGQP